MVLKEVQVVLQMECAMASMVFDKVFCIQWQNLDFKGPCFGDRIK